MEAIWQKKLPAHQEPYTYLQKNLNNKNLKNSFILASLAESRRATEIFYKAF